jgi:hypothetical protein
MWTPIVHERFPDEFRDSVRTLLCCHNVLSKQRGLNLGKIPTDVMFRIINWLPHDWFSEEQVFDDDDDDEEHDDEDEDEEDDDEDDDDESYESE